MAAIRARRGRRGRSRGQALVEFALVIPLFILILSGVLDFGFMLYSRMTVIDAAREGARAAVTAADTSTVPTLAHNAVVGASTSLTLANLSDSESCVAASGTCNFTSGSPTQAKKGDSVKVTVTYSYRSFFPLLFGSSITLTSSEQMVVE